MPTLLREKSVTARKQHVIHGSPEQQVMANNYHERRDN